MEARTPWKSSIPVEGGGPARSEDCIRLKLAANR